MFLPHLKHISFIHKANLQKDIGKDFYLQWKCSRDAGSCSTYRLQYNSYHGYNSEGTLVAGRLRHWMEDNSMAAGVIRQCCVFVTRQHPSGRPRYRLIRWTRLLTTTFLLCSGEALTLCLETTGYRIHGWSHMLVVLTDYRFSPALSRRLLGYLCCCDCKVNFTSLRGIQYKSSWQWNQV